MQNEDIVLTIDGVGFTERELKSIGMCKDYAGDAFGAPNHLLMVVVDKLARMIERKHQFTSNWWSSV